MSIALFYKNPRLLDSGPDADLRVRKITDLSFARNVNTIPINLNEFAQAARHYPIGFIGESGIPMAIVGLQETNAFLDAEGRWKAGAYVPAFVRRYPFIFADTEVKGEYKLCIDDTPETVSRTEGERLFEGGKPTGLTNKAAEFCRDFHQAALATDAFAKAIRTAGLLVPRQADTKLAAGPSFRLVGFKLVDTEKLRKIPARTLGQWNDKNWLAPLYAHVQSMTNWSNLLDLMPQSEVSKESAPAA